MSSLLQLLSAHELAPYLMALADPLNPPPKPPKGLEEPVATMLGWAKWGVMVCGVAGLLICGGQMALGRKHRSTMAADGATGIPWVLGGLSLTALSAGIVKTFLS